MDFGRPLRAIGNFVGGLFGRGRDAAPGNPAHDPYAVEHFPLDREKVHAGPADLQLPAFLPYLDEAQTVGETPVMRAAYRRMLSEPVVKSATLGKIFAVGSQDLHLRPFGKKPLRKKNLHTEAKKWERSVAIADHCRWNLEDRLRGGVAEMVWDILIGGLVDGHSVNEKVWGSEQRSAARRGKWVLRDLKPKDVDQDIVLILDSYKNVVGIQGLRYNAGQVYDPRDFLIYTHLALYDTPTGMSDFRASYGDYWFLDTCRKLRALAGEKRALPTVAGTYPDPTKQAALEAALRSLRTQSHLAVPKDVTLQVLDLLGRSDEFFKSWQADLQERLALGISGATLQMLAGREGQERGDTKTHNRTAGLQPWFLSSRICHLLNDHEQGLIPDMVDYNYTTGGEYPRASMGGVDDAELAEALKVDLGLRDLGFRHSRTAIQDRYGREEADEEEDELVPPGQAPGGSPPVPGDTDNTGVPDDLDPLLGIHKHAEWDESKHPRGQPDNPGQFSSSPGGRVGTVSPAGSKPVSAPRPFAGGAATSRVASPALEKIHADARTALADPAHPMNRLKAHLAPARFGAGPAVPTLRSTSEHPLSTADHQKAAEFHARAGAILHAQGELDLAQSHFEAARYQHTLARRKGPPGAATSAPGGSSGQSAKAVGGNDHLPDQSRPVLDAAQKKAIDAYTFEAYEDINDALRGGGAVAPEHQATHAALQRAFAAAGAFREPVLVRRGMSLSPAQTKRFLAGIRPGGHITIGGYTSTTTGPIPEEHAGNVEIEIAARRGLDVSPYSRIPEERELLLDHNSRFRIDHVETAQGKVRIRLSQIPE